MQALITGGTSGLGAGVATQLAQAGWSVTVVGRNAVRGQQIATTTGGQFLQADLACMANVRALAAQITSPLDALVLAAGSLALRSELTAEGVESIFATNYLSKFALVEALLPRINANGVIVMVSGNGNHAGVPTDWEQPVTGFKAAFKAALATDIFAAQLAARAPHLRVHTCYPGMVRTNLLRSAVWPVRMLFRLFGIPVERGSSYITRLVTTPQQTIHWKQDQPMHFAAPLPEGAPAQALWAYSAYYANPTRSIAIGAR